MTRTRRRALAPALALVLVALAFAAGLFLGARRQGGSAPAPAAHEHGAATTWTCSMHPQIQLPQPGACPLCGMDLIPAGDDDGAALDPDQVRLSVSARKLARVQVAPVTRRAVARTVSMVGKVTYDETRVETIAARFAGRLDRLFVDYTGVPVKTGDHLASIYSPELLSAQQELLQAGRAAQEVRGGAVPFLQETTRATVEASREKLRLWGLKPDQIARIEKSGKLSDHLTLYAHQAGIVVEKHRSEGDYVQEGSKIYTVADLTQLWVHLDAYESDLAWVRYGQAVEFETEAYPGETFEGRISFVDPVLDERTRTVKVRVNVDNQAGRLKPGMFVRGRVHAELMGPGRVYDRNLAGKWISPMHPEVVEDEPGSCRVCGMPLVAAETLGFVGSEPTRALPLVVPATAPLLTGERAVVYVEDPGAADPTYQARVVTLGPRAGEYYVVRDGLKEGELVVVQGAFKLDSALQIRAGRSMMSQPSKASGPAEPRDHHGHEDHARHRAPEPFEGQELVAQLARELAALLAADAADAALAHVKASAVPADLAPPEGEAGTSPRTRAHRVLLRMQAAGDVAALREQYAVLSDLLLAHGASAGPDTQAFACPMAFDDRGARWIQGPGPIANPYFGSAMLRCGEPYRPGATRR